MIKILTTKAYNALIQRNQELETRNIVAEGELELCKQFETIGDEKLTTCYNKLDALLIKNNKKNDTNVSEPQREKGDSEERGVKAT